MSEPSKAVFLSYASQDAEAAKRICEALRSAGVEVWFDQEGGLEHGDEWDAKIRRQIKECVLFLPIISANTQAREEGYFRIEWDLAAERAQGIAAGVAFILPILVDDTREPDALVPDRFRKVQWTRLPGGQVSPDVLARFLKLWSHRTGVLRHGAAQADANLVGRGLPTPPPGQMAGSGPLDKLGAGDPALQHQEAAAPRRALGPRLLLGALAILVGGAVAYFVFRPRRSPQEIAQIVAQAESLAEKTAAKSAKEEKPGAPPAAAPSVAPAGPERISPAKGKEPAADQGSVAVLAFANLSDDKENEYFSDGISEELLTVLQKIPGLHVAARTSAFSFKGKNATAQEIGAKLGVAHLVEGSVQKSGTRVKVTAHLSRAATGEELWTKSYTRELKDVFALQEELALAIVGELRGQLAGGENVAAVKAAVKGGTTNPEAYQQYLQGRYYLNQFAEKPMRQALGFFAQAVELDPSFALGWAELSRAHAWFAEFSTELGREGFDAHVAKAREATARALALEPSLPEALLARSEIQLNVDFDWRGADATLRTALALAPADPALITAAGNLAGAHGEMAQSIDLLRQAVALDPVNSAARSFLAYNLALAGHHAEAQAEYPRVEELNPSAPWAFAGLGMSYLLQGRFEEAVTTAQRDAAEWASLLVTAMARWGQKRVPASDAALAQLQAKFADTAAYQVAEVYAYRADADQAFAWLERALRQRDGGLIGLRFDPRLANLTNDPRWPVFLRKMGLADDQLK